jgi:hypothetical protein
MAKSGRERRVSPSAAYVPEQAPRGSVRACTQYTGELARHRVITADGQDMAVATSEQSGQRPRFLTVAYPVQHGYLVMMRQPLCTLRATDEATAYENHEKLLRVLAEAGVGVVRARRALAARRRAEHRLGDDAPSGGELIGQQANAEELAVVEIDLA